MFDVLVFVGRFQPCHNGHLQVLASALRQAAKVIVILGSARRARNIKNPFNDQERRDMLLAAVSEVMADAAGRLSIVPLRDYYDNARWVDAVKQAVAASVVDAPAGARIGLIGHAKDDSSYYLREFPDWPLALEDNHAGISATNLRRLLFERCPGFESELAQHVPKAVASFLDEFRRSETYRDLCTEYALVASDRAAWQVAPYPPVFVTVDAVVRCHGHLLMVRRGGHPGRGQWALPGGFLDQREWLRDGALRELNEETGLAVEREILARSLAGKAVFDHPDRSVRGRTITHAFFFDLPGDTLPSVRADDDAADARWVPITELIDMETTIFEDHFHIADSFLGVSGERFLSATRNHNQP